MFVLVIYILLYILLFVKKLCTFFYAQKQQYFFWKCKMASSDQFKRRKSDDDADADADIPKLVTELREEEERGLFRNIAPQYARIANAYYKEQTGDRFEFINPTLEAPAGTRFKVLVGTVSDHQQIARGYVNIVTTPHGWFVRIHPDQLVTPLSQLTATRGTPLSTVCGWLSFRIAGINIYYAGRHLPDANNHPTTTTTTTSAPMKRLSRGQTSITSFMGVSAPVNIKQPSDDAPPTVGNKYRKIKEFAPGFVYVNLQNAFVVRD